MAITVRNEETLKTLEALIGKLNIKTKTGIVDYVVERHLDLVYNLRTANQNIQALEKELYEVKSVIKQNSQAVKDFALMCDKINKEG